MNPPTCPRQRAGRGDPQVLDGTVRSEPDGEFTLSRVSGRYRVCNLCTVGSTAPAPVPAAKVVFQRARAGIGVEVAVALPVQRRAFHRDIDARRGRERLPGMARAFVQAEHAFISHLRVQRYPAIQGLTERCAALVNMNIEPVTAPDQSTRANLEKL